MVKYLRTDLRYARFWLALALFAFSAIVLAAVFPFEAEPPWPGHWDKTLHALSFTMLIIAMSGPFPKSARLYILAGLLLCGVLIEIIQIPLEGRNEEWGDLLANCVGLTVGLVLLRFRIGDWCLFLEQRLGLQ